MSTIDCVWTSFLVGYVLCRSRTELSCVSSKSTRQVLLANSSTEAEYIALYEATLEIIWLRYLLADLGCPQLGPTTAFEDNESCIRIAEGSSSQKTKHFARRLHYVRESVVSDLIEINHLGSDKMTADLLTKALPRRRFHSSSVCSYGRRTSWSCITCALKKVC